MTDKIKASAEQVFKDHEGIESIYVCEDGAAFLPGNKSLAFYHARQEGLGEPVKVNRQDVVVCEDTNNGAAGDNTLTPNTLTPGPSPKGRGGKGRLAVTPSSPSPLPKAEGGEAAPAEATPVTPEATPEATPVTPEVPAEAAPAPEAEVKEAPAIVPDIPGYEEPTETEQA